MMPDTILTADIPHVHGPAHPGATTVVLLAPELFATPPRPDAMKAALVHPAARVRVLLRLAAPGDLDLAEALANAGIAVEILVPDGVTVRPTSLPVARMPPGSRASDTDELALALSDVLLVEDSTLDSPLVRLARELSKPILAPGERLPHPIGERRSIAHRLDPDQPGWHAVLRRLAGRTEQFLLELAAFNWRGRHHRGIARSWTRLKACAWTDPWHLKPFFAPETPVHWRDVLPDQAAAKPNRPIVAAFDRLDRSALYGSYIHRDLAWLAHGAAAFAVLFAVLGHLWPGGPHWNWVWPGCELAALLGILVTTVVSRMVRLQDRWTACRFGAEQLRIARLCLPLMVAPSALCSVDDARHGEHSLRALAEVKRAVRDQGLPRVAPDVSALAAARWVQFIVADQCRYHEANHSKLHCAEQRLTMMTLAVFAAALLAVVWHLFVADYAWLLIPTAAGPAFAAAFHGAATRLGIVHRIELSRDAEAELALVRRDLNRLIDRADQTAPTWDAVRGLAFRAAEAMGRETKSWHSQVRRQKDDIT